MIIKRTRGVSAAKALAYDYGPGRAMEHQNPRRVAGSVAGRDWRNRSRAMQEKLRADGDTGKGVRGRVIRLAVSAAPEDRVMSDREWGDVARRVVGEFSKNPENFAWEAVRHDPRHIHVTLLARGHDGRLISESHDYRRYGQISAGIERDYALRVVDRSKEKTPERKNTRTDGRQAAKALHREKITRPRSITVGADRPPRERTTSREDRAAAARAEAARRAAAREARRQERDRGRGGRGE